MFVFQVVFLGVNYSEVDFEFLGNKIDFIIGEIDWYFQINIFVNGVGEWE